MKIRNFACVVFFFSLSICAAAQEKVIAVRAGQIIDGTGGAPIENGVVVVRGDTIEAVGPASRVTIPPGAEIVDLKGETLLPGLIDTHTHLSLRYGIDVGSGVEGLVGQLMQPDAIQMLRIVRNARVQLLCGVTTSRMTGEAHWNDLHLRNAIGEGMVPGPRLILGGPIITPTGGHFVDPKYWVDSPWEARRQVRENFHHGAEWIKVTLIDRSPEATMFTLEELKALVDEAHRLGIKVTVHATGRWGSSMKTAILAGADNIEHARPMTDEIIQMMVEHGTTMSFTPLVYVGLRPDKSTWRFMDTGAKSPGDWIDYGRQHYFDYRKENPDVETVDRDYEDNEANRAGRDFFPSIRTQQSQALAAHRAGVPLSLGLDTLYYGGIGNSIEFLIEGGFPPMDAIRAATAVAAQNLGYGDRLGTLEVGKRADMISLRADPLTERWAWNRVHLVMKDGVRYDGLSWN